MTISTIRFSPRDRKDRLAVAPAKHLRKVGFWNTVTKSKKHGSEGPGKEGPLSLDELPDEQKRIKSFHIEDSFLMYRMNLWICGNMEYAMRMYHMDTGFEYDFDTQQVSGVWIASEDHYTIVIELHKRKIPIPILYHEALHAAKTVMRKLNLDDAEELECRIQQKIVDDFVKQIKECGEFKFTWKYQKE